MPAEYREYAQETLLDRRAKEEGKGTEGARFEEGSKVRGRFENGAKVRERGWMRARIRLSYPRGKSLPGRQSSFPGERSVVWSEKLDRDPFLHCCSFARLLVRCTCFACASATPRLLKKPQGKWTQNQRTEAGNAVDRTFLNAGSGVEDGFRNRVPEDMARRHDPKDMARKTWPEDMKRLRIGMTKLGPPLLLRDHERDDREDKLKLGPLEGLRVSNRADSRAPGTVSGLSKRTGKRTGKPTDKKTLRYGNVSLL